MIDRPTYPRRLWPALCVLLLLSVTAASGRVLLDETVAVVNAEVITRHDVERLRQRLQFPEDMPFRQVLEQAIEQRIIDQQIRKLGVSVSPKEVDRAIDNMLQAQGASMEDLKNQLQLAGKSFDEFREETADEIRRVKIVNQEVKANVALSEGELDEAIEKYRAQQNETTVYTLQILLLPCSGDVECAATEVRAGELRKQALNGASFEEMVLTQGAQSMRGNKGILRNVERDGLQKPIAEAIEGREVGEIPPPVRVASGVFVIKLLEVDRRATLNEENLKPELREALLRNKFQVLYTRWVEDLKNHASIKILYQGDAAGR